MTAKKAQNKKTIPKTTVKRTTKSRAVKKPAPIKRVSQSAKKALVPHKENNFRPYLMRLRGVAGVIALVLFVQVAYGYVTTGNFNVLGRVAQITTEELLQDTNKERQDAGLPSLQLNDDLSHAAYLKAQDMLKKDYWAHTSPDGVEPWKWLGDVEYNYSSAGENLAKNYPSAGATINAWMNSPTHKANIISEKYTEIGFATASGTLEGSPSTIVVALYASPAKQAAIQVAPPASAFASSVTNTPSSPVAYFGSALQSLSPATIMALVIMTVVAVVGAVTHRYRHKLPKSWQKTWRSHQGLLTFYGMIFFGVVIILATGGGQI